MRINSTPQSSYLPELLLNRLRSQPSLNNFEAEPSLGVLLLSDIQQFTSLVAQYTNRGQEGLEQLTWLLNSYFETMVEIVAKHGGDILYVAGDAFLCHWQTNRASRSESLLRAASCGLEIQQRISGQFQENREAMATRIGIGSGELWTGFFGGHKGRWELVVSGSALEEVIDAEAACTPGGVLVGPEAWSEISEYCDGAETDSNGTVLKTVRTRIESLPRASAGAPDGLDLRPFLPPALLDHVDIPETEWLAESRTVSVVMASITSLTSEPETLTGVQDGILKFQEIVDQCEGTVKVDVDSKGVLLLATFGLPPKAHENDAERAAYCAQRLATTLGRATTSGIGVATGRAICGAFGGDTRRDYMVRGGVINLASRLMAAAAPGMVLCDTATYSSAADRMTFTEGVSISAKGLAEPIKTFEPMQRKRPVRITGDIVGREAERSRFNESLANSGHDIFVVEAEAGLGKSCLLAHAVRLAEERGIRVLQAAADAIERSTTYYPWRPVFMDLLGLTASISADDEMVQHVERSLEELPHLAVFLPLLSDVLPISLPDNETTIGMIGDIRVANMQKLLIGLLRNAADAGPLMLAVEDVHWFDSASWELLIRSLQEIPFAISVLTMRPVGDQVSNDLGRLYNELSAKRMHLSSMAPEETKALIARHLHIEEVPDELATFVHERATGHPFFAEEILKALLQRGALEVENERCTKVELSKVDLPATVEQVIVSRLDALSAEEQMCLKVASVIGRMFPNQLVEQAYPIEHERTYVAERLRNIAQAELVDEETQIPELQYLFRHFITRDVTYGIMPGAQRRPLHRAVAKCLETSGGEQSTVIPLLAHHWSEAADGPKAVFYLEKAGHQSMRDGAFREAVIFLSRAIEFMNTGAIKEDPKRRALWEKDLGIASYFLGDLAASVRHLELALSELHRPVPSGDAATLLADVREFVRQMMHNLVPAHYRGRRASEKALLDEAVECYKQLGQAYYMEGESAPRLLYLTLSGLNLGEEAGDSAPLARVMINAAVLYYVIGQSKAAESLAQRAIEMAEQPNHIAAQGYVWHLKALLHAQQARWIDCRAASDRALEIATAMADNALESEVRLVRSAAARAAGDITYAPTAWSQARQVADRIGDVRLRTRSLLDEVENRLIRGETEKAEDALAKALAIPSPATDHDMDIEKRRSVAVTRMRQGRILEALEEADFIFGHIKKNPPTGYHTADHFAAVIEIYLEALRDSPTGLAIDYAGIRRRARRGARTLAKYSKIFINVHPRSHLLLGVYQSLLGKKKKAAQRFEKAGASAETLGMPFEEARALLELGRLTGGTGEVSRARNMFLQLGAAHYVNQCELLLPKSQLS